MCRRGNRQYDDDRVYGECADHGCGPIIPLRETPDVKRGADKPPTCEHGTWRFWVLVAIIPLTVSVIVARHRRKPQVADR